MVHRRDLEAILSPRRTSIGLLESVEDCETGEWI